MSLSLRFAAGSHKGLIREGNEDSGYAGPRLLAVADGMGGAAAGEVASSTVLSSIVELDARLPNADVREVLRAAVDRANDRLRIMIEDDPQKEGMGTTLTALVWTGGGELGLVHIGDSRAYLLREGGLVQITQDHTWVQRLVDEGRITEEEAGHHPQRSLLMRALDGRGQVDPDLSIREARVGDRYLICSDGLSGVVTRETMEDTLLRHANPAGAVDELIQLAVRGGGPDNITCVVADVVDTIETPGMPPEAPTFVGAVERPGGDTATFPTTPASRASELAAGTYPDNGEYGPEAFDAEPVSRRRPKPLWRRTLPVWGTVGVLLVAGAGAAYWWTQQQYYVATSGDHIAVYRGVDQDLLGFQLSSTYEDYKDIPTALVGPSNQASLKDGIDATSLSDARSTVDRLRHQATVCQAVINWNNDHPAGAQPSGTPSGEPSDTPTPSPSVTPAALPSMSLSPASNRTGVHPAGDFVAIVPVRVTPTASVSGNRTALASRSTPPTGEPSPSTSPGPVGAGAASPEPSASATPPAPADSATYGLSSPDDIKLIPLCGIPSTGSG